VSSRIVVSVNLIPSAESVTAMSMSLNSVNSFSVLEKTTKSDSVCVSWLAPHGTKGCKQTHSAMCAGLGLI
jgi:hypothetical protein